MSLSLTVKAAIHGTHTKVLDLATAALPLDAQALLTLTDGTGANQADRVFHDQRTLTASATEDLDLAGSLTDAYGATITFAKVKAILVKAAAGNTNNVNVTRPAANGVPLYLAASDGVGIPPSGCLLLAGPGAAGLATVTAGTGDLLTFTNSAGGTPVTYDVVIVGTSA